MADQKLREETIIYSIWIQYIAVELKCIQWKESEFKMIHKRVVFASIWSL